MDVTPDLRQTAVCESGAQLDEAAVAASGRVPQQDDKVRRREHQEERHECALHEADEKALLIAGHLVPRCVHGPAVDAVTCRL